MAWLTELIFFIIRHRAHNAFDQSLRGVRGEVDRAGRHDGARLLQWVQRCSRPQRPETLRREAGNRTMGQNYYQKRLLARETHRFAYLGKCTERAD